MSEIDYKELLIKYMALVFCEEGITYADRLHPDRYVTLAECDALKSVEDASRELAHKW